MLTKLSFFQIDGNSIIQLLDKHSEYYASLFRTIESEYENRKNQTDEMIRNYLSILLHKTDAEYNSSFTPPKRSHHSAKRILSDFCRLYTKDLNVINEGQIVSLKSIKDYASELGVAPNHLNDTIKSLTGKSASQLIHHRLIKQASMCLKQSDKNISEIAFLLGFEDASYFSKFYKKHTGKTPSEFRTTIL